MPDSYQEQDEVAAAPVRRAVASRKVSIFRDPVVRGLSIFAVVLVVLYLATILGALLMGILNPTEPRTRAERDIQFYEGLVAQDPKNTENWRSYISALMDSKQYLKAQDVLDRAKKAVDEKNTMDLTTAQAQIHFANGKYDQCIKLTDTVRTKLKAFYDESVKTPGTAEAKGQEIDDNYYDVLVLKAAALEELGKPAEAIKALDLYLKDNPTAADVFVKRGLLRTEAGDKAGAEKDFRAALKFIPNDQAALDGLEKIGVKP